MEASLPRVVKHCGVRGWLASAGYGSAIGQGWRQSLVPGIVGHAQRRARPVELRAERNTPAIRDAAGMPEAQRAAWHRLRAGAVPRQESGGVTRIAVWDERPPADRRVHAPPRHGAD